MTGDYETIIYENDGRRARITFNRPHILNAVAMTGAREFDRLAAEIADDTDIRIVTIAGTGRAFSTGIDLKDLAAGLIDDSYFDLWDRALRRFETMDKLVICLIHGYALGGGLQLALAADIRVSTPSARLGLPAIKEGDKRILVVDGVPVDYALARVPAEGELRGNLAAGGRGVGRPLTDADRAIAEEIGPYVREKGLLFVGLDVIGDKLTEINVTSPTCVRELDKQFDINIAALLFDAIERRLA